MVQLNRSFGHSLTQQLDLVVYIDHFPYGEACTAQERLGEAPLLSFTTNGPPFSFAIDPK